MDFEIDFEAPSKEEFPSSSLHSAATVPCNLDDPNVKAQIQMCYQKRKLGRPRKNPEVLAKPYPIPGRVAGRPRVEKPVLPKRPIGRPRGTTKPKPPVDCPKRKAGRPEGTTLNSKNPRPRRLGRPPGRTNKNKLSISDTDLNDSEYNSSTNDSFSNSKKHIKPPDESIGEGLSVLRGDLPSLSKGKRRGPRPEVQKYPASDDRILCPKCGRVFLESERKNMYNHMHKHRVEERRLAEEAKQKVKREAETEQTEYRESTKVEYVIIEESQIHLPQTTLQQQHSIQPAHQQIIYRTPWH